MVAIARFSVAAALLLGLSATSIAALPSRNVNGGVFFNLSPPAPPAQNLTDFRSLALSDPSFGVLSLSVSGTPAPVITAAAELGPSSIGVIFGRSTAIVTYALEILGPAGAVPVLIDVAGAGVASAGAGASFVVQSSWDLLDGLASLAGDHIASGQLSGSFSQSFDHTVALTLATNHTYSVFMLADAEAAATAVGSHSQANAFIDPQFSFGLGVDADLYGFHFSDGIGNVSAVPEPGALALMLAGLASIAGFARARRHR
jgi:hypothetical protein